MASATGKELRYMMRKKDSMPLSIAIGPGNEHDSKKLLELVEGLWEKPV
jgi:transposase